MGTPSLANVHLPQPLDPANAELFMDGFLSESVEYPAIFAVKQGSTSTIQKSSLLPPAAYQDGVDGATIPTSPVEQGNQVTYRMVEKVIGYEVGAFSLAFLDAAALGSFIRAMGASAARKVNSDCMGVLAGGHTVSGPDGVSLFNAAHPVESGSPISNRGTTELDNDALEAAAVVGMRMLSPEGLISPVYYDTLVVSPDRLFAAEQTVGNTLLTTGGAAINDVNVIGRRFKTIVSSADLADLNDWACIDSTRARFNLYWRQMPNPTTFIDAKSKNLVANDRIIYAVGHDNTWRSVFGAQVA